MPAMPTQPAKAHDERLAAGLDELDDVRVQSDGAHGHHDQELAERLERGEHAADTPTLTHTVVITDASRK